MGAVRHLGNLGRVNEPHEIDFEWFGATIRVAQDANDMLVLEFFDSMSTIDTNNDVAALAATRALLKGDPGDPGHPGSPATGKRRAIPARPATEPRAGLIEPEDWPTFWSLALKHNQRWINLLNVAKAITQALSSLPFGPLPDASNGQVGTGTTSKDGSSSQADMATTMAALQGRPDLKMAVLGAELARRNAA